MNAVDEINESIKIHTVKRAAFQESEVSLRTILNEVTARTL